MNGQALYDETYDNYRRYVNPTLARVMKVSGSPVEVHAQGTTIWDHHGKAYLDFAGGYGVFTLGHTHPRVVAAVKAQMELMSLSGKTMFNPVLGRASKRLAELAPGDLTIVFFANSGTEAVEGAINSPARRPSRKSSFRRPTRITAKRSVRSRSAGASISKSRSRRCSRRRSSSATVRPKGSKPLCAMRPPLSSNPCKAKAASTCRRKAICATCARSATRPARSLLPTKCKRVWDAAASFSAASATASSRTL